MCRIGEHSLRSVSNKSCVFDSRRRHHHHHWWADHVNSSRTAQPPATAAFYLISAAQMCPAMRRYWSMLCRHVEVRASNDGQACFYRRRSTHSPSTMCVISFLGQRVLRAAVTNRTVRRRLLYCICCISSGEQRLSTVNATYLLRLRSSCAFPHIGHCRSF